MTVPVDVCVVGSANLDLVASTARLPGPGETVLGHAYAEHAGGKGLNQAVSAARSGATTAFVGAVGDDAAGRRLRAVLESDGIDHSLLEVADAPTGRALILVDDQGENTIVVVPGANAAVTASTLPASRVVLAQLEVPLDTVGRTFERARRAGAITIFNPAPASAVPEQVLASADIVVPNEHELELVGGVEALLAAGCSAVVVTLGGAGVEVHRPDGVTAQAAYEVDVVDTTGAGDAFNGALAARLAAGDTLDGAVAWASAAGALATTAPGAVPAQPDAAAITELMAAGRRRS